MAKPKFPPTNDLSDLQREAVARMLADDPRPAAALIGELVTAGLVSLVPTQHDGGPSVGVALTETGAMYARKP